jgi:hypothetical protein
MVSLCHYNYNGVHINMAIDKFNGSSRSQGSGIDLQCINDGKVHIQAHGIAQHLDNVLGLDQRSRCAPIVRRKEHGGFGVMFTIIQNASPCGSNSIKSPKKNDIIML